MSESRGTILVGQDWTPETPMEAMCGDIRGALEDFSNLKGRLPSSIYIPAPCYCLLAESGYAFSVSWLGYLHNVFSGIHIKPIDLSNSLKQ